MAPLKKSEPEPVVRFETPPGKQMQADFTTVRRRRDPLLALVATMGYSRASFVKFTTGEDAILGSVPVLLPSPVVLAAFENLAVATDEQRSRNESMAQTLATLRDTLLPRLISGQLRLPAVEVLVEGLTYRTL